MQPALGDLSCDLRDIETANLTEGWREVLERTYTFGFSVRAAPQSGETFFASTSRWQLGDLALVQTAHERGDGCRGPAEIAADDPDLLGLLFMRRGTLGLDFEGMLLDALAVVEMSNAATLSGANAMLRQGGGDSLVIAVLGDLSGDDASELARVRHSTTSGVAFAMDTASWLGGKPMAQARARFVGSAQVLRVGGWRVVEVEPGDRLPELWELAARRGTGGTGGTGTTGMTATAGRAGLAGTELGAAR